MGNLGVSHREGSHLSSAGVCPGVRDHPSPGRQHKTTPIDCGAARPAHFGALPQHHSPCVTAVSARWDPENTDSHRLKCLLLTLGLSGAAGNKVQRRNTRDRRWKYDAKNSLICEVQTSLLQ